MVVGGQYGASVEEVYTALKNGHGGCVYVKRDGLPLLLKPTPLKDPSLISLTFDYHEERLRQDLYYSIYHLVNERPGTLHWFGSWVTMCAFLGDLAAKAEKNIALEAIAEGGGGR